MTQLNNQTVVVTGAGRGIGREIALHFARAGARVIVGDLIPENAERVVDEIRASGGTACSAAVDVANESQVDRFMEQANAAWGTLDVLVNVAGIGLTKLLLHTTAEEWETVLRVNLTGTFLCCRAAARIMVEQRRGRIINIASLSGQRGGTGRAAYGASKAGVTILTKVMAVELAAYGITVNEIAPGPVNTEMTAVTHDKATRQAYRQLIPMRRYAEKHEISAAAVFLASSEADFINGHTLNVDGGFGAAGLIFDLQE